jgi:hypothetical protein
MTMAVAGRMTFEKLTAQEQCGSVEVSDATKPPGAGRLRLTKKVAPPWGGLGGYPITPRVLNVPLV